MKKGLLIYDRVDASVNKWFTGRLTELAREKNIDLELFICDGRNADLEKFESIDLCINRSRYAELSEFFEADMVRYPFS